MSPSRVPCLWLPRAAPQLKRNQIESITGPTIETKLTSFRGKVWRYVVLAIEDAQNLTVAELAAGSSAVKRVGASSGTVPVSLPFKHGYTLLCNRLNYPIPTSADTFLTSARTMASRSTTQPSQQASRSPFFRQRDALMGEIAMVRLSLLRTLILTERHPY